MPYFPYQGKQIFYSESGTGRPLVMLHGNTASSILFEFLLPLYQRDFRVIRMDFLGNGRSDRVGTFPEDLWIEQAGQVIALIEHLKIKKAGLLGTSGGAWAAVNAALKRPDLVHRVVADSFDGRTLHASFADDLQRERTSAKNDPGARQFYEWCQGADWETVVDRDTQALVQCARHHRPLFCKPLETLRVPVLFMGSLQDTMCRRDMAEEYAAMARLVPHGTVHLFGAGGHPAVLSNAEAAAAVVRQYLCAE
ncbi:MAG: alpha/beta fold hydrolase [Blautia massiliensis (ex Durand et al. 2017)]